MLSALNRKENLTNSNVKALSAEDESSHVLELKGNYQFDTLVLKRGTSPDCNRTVTQSVVPSLVSAAHDRIGVVALYTVKARLLLKDI